MQIDLLTIFPEYFDSPLRVSLIGKAVDAGTLTFRTIDIRDFADNKHNSVDDIPYGGGPGMIMTPEPIQRALDSLDTPNNARRIYLSPSGKPLTQALARELTETDQLVLLCGRYEGIDQRVIEHNQLEEISVGDYVLNGGEAAALVLIEAVTRLLPGVIGKAESLEVESFETGLLEHPQYTRPASWRGLDVPEVLLSGHHGHIEKWRKEQRRARTAHIRPDLLKDDSENESL